MIDSHFSAEGGQSVKPTAFVGGQSAQPSLQFTSPKDVSLQPHDIILYFNIL
jgi:hypothetical protein